MSEVNAAPTIVYYTALLPKIDGKNDGTVEIVLPGDCCNGVLYVSTKFVYDVDGICAVEVFDVDILDFASVIPVDEEFNFDI